MPNGQRWPPPTWPGFHGVVIDVIGVIGMPTPAPMLLLLPEGPEGTEEPEGTEGGGDVPPTTPPATCGGAVGMYGARRGGRNVKAATPSGVEQLGHQKTFKF
jgi:hypothetical protein